MGVEGSRRTKESKLGQWCEEARTEDIIWRREFPSCSAERCCLSWEKIVFDGPCEARKLLLSVAAQLSGLRWQAPGEKVSKRGPPLLCGFLSAAPRHATHTPRSATLCCCSLRLYSSQRNDQRDQPCVTSALSPVSCREC